MHAWVQNTCGKNGSMRIACHCMRVSACASPHARLRMRVSVEIFLLAHRVLGRRRRVEEGVVVGIDEDLRAARVGLSSVGHRERAHRVRDLCT